MPGCELFDYLPNVQSWVKDLSGRYQWVNVEFLLNYALEHREQVVGRTDYDLSPPHLAAQFDADDQLVLAGNPVINRVEMVGRFDHTARWCLTTKLPLRNQHGRVTGTMGMTRISHDPTTQEWAAMPLGRVIRHISTHFHEALENEQLARLAGLSVRAFERQFRLHYRLAPRQYLRQLRVRMAARALVHGDAPIAAVASEHGFSDQSHFTREFRAVVGETPAGYRQRYRH